MATLELYRDASVYCAGLKEALTHFIDKEALPEGYVAEMGMEFDHVRAPATARSSPRHHTLQRAPSHRRCER